jgi:hypothetical protein
MGPAIEERMASHLTQSEASGMDSENFVSAAGENPWEDEDTEEFDMESYWDQDSGQPLVWADPWTLSP